MMNEFRAAMSKMAIIGHDRSQLIDCSEVIPGRLAYILITMNVVHNRFVEPQPFTGTATIPAGHSQSEIEQAVSSATVVDWTFQHELMVMVGWDYSVRRPLSRASQSLRGLQ